LGKEDQSISVRLTIGGETVTDQGIIESTVVSSAAEKDTESASFAFEV
jgi:hypothetical protein